MAWQAPLIFCAAFSASVVADDMQKKNELQSMAIAERDFKKAIIIQQEKIDSANASDKGQYTKELALLYLKDQDQEKAFEAFLKALDQAPAISDSSLNSLPIQNVEDYKRAFTIYLDPVSESPSMTAMNLIRTLTPILDAKPESYLLNYFVAIAYANIGRYEEFFHHFDRAYQFYPVHYLAFKTKAVLHIKLLERLREEMGRSNQKQLIVSNLTQALEREPLDTSIYRLLISFSPDEKKREQVQLCLNKIINGNIMIPRSELIFYVIEAVDANERELAQRFIGRATEWYPKSRLVASAQNYLDSK